MPRKTETTAAESKESKEQAKGSANEPAKHPADVNDSSKTPVPAESATKESEPAAKSKPKTPRGWYMAGSEPTHYEAGIDTSIAHSGSRCAFMQPAVENPEGFGTLMQCFATQKYLGKRMRMSLWIKVEDVLDWASAWLRVDGEGRGKMLSFDNMCNRRIAGTTDWKKYEIVLDVPLGSTNVCFGTMLSGRGKIWMDDIAFDDVGLDVALTDCPCMNKEKRSEPRNLNFEEKENE